MSYHDSGTRIAGRYEVAGRPLVGGMGIVYLCFDHGEQRPVALKTFKPEYLPDRAARERFLEEGNTWVRLGRHAHIVHAYTVARIGDGREVYLVLELVAREEGRKDASLRAWLTPGQPLPASQALLITLQIVRGMRHAVETIPGFVHRDLKPQNVLVGADRLGNAAINRVRVTDFGLVPGLRAEQAPAATTSDLAQGLSRLTRIGSVLGTPPYMAPEQWEGSDVTLQADIYAAGCILGEMLSGRMLVRGGTLAELRRAHQGGQAWTNAQSAIPAALRDLLAGCLAVEAGRRYGDWAALEGALTAAYLRLAGQPVPADEAPGGLSRAERVAAGTAYNAMGASYVDMGNAQAALGYFERAHHVGQVEGERHLEAAGLTHLGIAYAGLGDARRAIGYYEQALSIDCEIGDRRGVGAALNNLGEAYRQLGDARRAIGYYEQALVIVRDISDRPIEAAALSNLGAAFANLGDARRAIGCYEQALAIDRGIGNRQGEGTDLGNLGLAYANLGDARQAIDCQAQALVISREIGDRRGEGNHLGNLGNTYARLGHARRAVDYYAQQLIIARETSDLRGESNALNSMGLAYAHLGDIRQAISYYEQALAIVREIGDRRGEGNDLGNLGSAYLQLGDARQAIDYLEKQLIIVREIGDRQGEGVALGNLGEAYRRLGDTHRAINYYEQALDITQMIGDRWGEGSVLGNLGSAHADLGDARRAVEYYNARLAIAKEIGDRRGESAALGNMGEVYRRLGDASRAIDYFKQALSIKREIGDGNGMANHSFNMALLYAEQGNRGAALPLAREAARLWGQMGHAANAQRAQQLVQQIEDDHHPAPGPALAQILDQFAPVIDRAVAAARGDRRARSELEGVFGQLTQNGWQIAEPTRRIWAGERNAARLTAGLDESDSLIVREILKRL